MTNDELAILVRKYWLTRHTAEGPSWWGAISREIGRRVKEERAEPGGFGDKHEKNVWKPTVKKGKARGRKAGSVVA